MIADTLIRTDKTLEERGLPGDSYFELVFGDDSEITEKEINWSSISEKITVSYLGGQKTVDLCTLPVKCIAVFHGGQNTCINVPEGFHVYQSVRGETTFVEGTVGTTQILGRTIGTVFDFDVKQEHYINAVLGVVEGIRK